MDTISRFTKENLNFSNMGISIFKEDNNENKYNEITGGNSNTLCHLSIPGGLYIRLPGYSNPIDFQESEQDHTKINVIEDFDIFIDLVSEREERRKTNKHFSLKNKIKKTAKKLTKSKSKYTYKTKQI